jgi:hypothetical protein
MTTDPPPPATWEINVLNVLTNRPGKLLVEASVGRVILVPPPGSGHLVPDGSLQQLHDALNVAKSVADMQSMALPLSGPGARATTADRSVATTAVAAHLTEVLRQLPKEIRQLIAISLAHEELP